MPSMTHRSTQARADVTKSVEGNTMKMSSPQCARVFQEGSISSQLKYIRSRAGLARRCHHASLMVSPTSAASWGWLPRMRQGQPTRCMLVIWEGVFSCIIGRFL